MEVKTINHNLQTLKEQLRNLMACSADLIERNSQIDTGGRSENVTPPPKLETYLEDFLSTCNVLELNLRTMQECLIQGRASLQNLPITICTTKYEYIDKIEPVEPNTLVTYNQFLTVVRYQVETAKAIKQLLEEFANKQCN